MFDSDNDGLLDVYVASGTTLDGDGPGATSTGTSVRNRGQLTFEDVTQKAGLAKVGWAQGVCVGDYDSDGFRDLFVTHYGQSLLYRNRGDGTFRRRDRARRIAFAWHPLGHRLHVLRLRSGRQARLAVTNYLEFDRAKVPEAGSSTFCLWKGLPVMCGPRGLPFSRNHLFHNDGGGRFSDVSLPSGIGKTKGCYGFTVVASESTTTITQPVRGLRFDGEPAVSQRKERHVSRGGAVVRRRAQRGRTGTRGMGIAAADYDEDGDTDIFKTNFSDDLPNLYHNIGGGTFEDACCSRALAPTSSMWAGARTSSMWITTGGRISFT